MSVGCRDDSQRIDGQADFDAVLRHEAITELAVGGAIATPQHAVDFDGLGKLEQHPASTRFVGNPTRAVAVASVVNVLELMNLVSGKV